jgi:hypothetical protein
MLRPSVRFLVVVMALVALGSIAIAFRGRSTIAAEAGFQDVMSLDRRISSVEQRIYTMESNINQIRQQVSLYQRPQTLPNQPDPAVDRLRTDIILIQQRLGDLECAVAKLDQRTLPKNEAEKAMAQGSDPCRLEPNTPLHIPVRRR